MTGLDNNMNTGQTRVFNCSVEEVCLECITALKLFESIPLSWLYHTEWLSYLYVVSRYSHLKKTTMNAH